MKLFMLLFLAFLHKSPAIAKKLKVAIFYESLCPDSERFIVNQLQPTWKEIENYTNIHLVPFGKSMFDGNEFECQHGPRECMGNRIQSCVLDLISSQSDQVNYASCFMRVFKHGNPDMFGQSCAEEVGVKWEKAEICIKGPKGLALQLQAEKETGKVAPRFIPTIVYNGDFTQIMQDNSLKNFRGEACSLIKEKHPEACSDPFVLQL